MKKVVSAGTLIGLVLSVYFLIQPAKVPVGQHELILPLSRGKVLLLNTVGYLKGYGGCEITGLSFYTTQHSTLLFSETKGVIFSKYAVDVLMTMPEREAYDIAQGAFERIQIKGRWSKTGLKLLFPLQLLYSDLEIAFPN